MLFFSTFLDCGIYSSTISNTWRRCRFLFCFFFSFSEVFLIFFIVAIGYNFLRSKFSERNLCPYQLYNISFQRIRYVDDLHKSMQIAEALRKKISLSFLFVCVTYFKANDENKLEHTFKLRTADFLSKTCSSMILKVCVKVTFQFKFRVILAIPARNTPLSMQ